MKNWSKEYITAGLKIIQRSRILVFVLYTFTLLWFIFLNTQSYLLGKILHDFNFRTRGCIGKSNKLFITLLYPLCHFLPVAISGKTDLWHVHLYSRICFWPSSMTHTPRWKQRLPISGMSLRLLTTSSAATTTWWGNWARGTKLLTFRMPSSSLIPMETACCRLMRYDVILKSVSSLQSVCMLVWEIML